jgi:hypothetical protein
MSPADERLNRLRDEILTDQALQASGRVELYPSDLRRLEHIARMIDAEAETWAEGFAVRGPSDWRWTSEYEWAHVRYFKLKRAAEYLRGIASRKRRPAPAPLSHSQPQTQIASTS